jgi:hypothetical protein
MDRSILISDISLLPALNRNHAIATRDSFSILSVVSFADSNTSGIPFPG